MHTTPAIVSQLLPVNTRLRRMMMIIPATNSAIINHGTHGLGSLTSAGTGGVYRCEVVTPSLFWEGFTYFWPSPGRVPLAVVRLPPVLRFGGATGGKCTG